MRSKVRAVNGRRETLSALESGEPSGGHEKCSSGCQLQGEGRRGMAGKPHTDTELSFFSVIHF